MLGHDIEWRGPERQCTRLPRQTWPRMCMSVCRDVQRLLAPSVGLHLLNSQGAALHCWVRGENIVYLHGPWQGRFEFNTIVSPAFCVISTGQSQKSGSAVPRNGYCVSCTSVRQALSAFFMRRNTPTCRGLCLLQHYCDRKYARNSE